MANCKKAGIKALCMAAGVVGGLTWAGACFADFLIVTYSDGRTQRVQLEEAGAAVQTIHCEETAAEPGPAGGSTAIRALYVRPAGERKPELIGEPSAPKNDKKNIRFKWGAPKTGE